MTHRDEHLQLGPNKIAAKGPSILTVLRVVGSMAVEEEFAN